MPIWNLFYRDYILVTVISVLALIKDFTNVILSTNHKITSEKEFTKKLSIFTNLRTKIPDCTNADGRGGQIRGRVIIYEVKKMFTKPVETGSSSSVIYLWRSWNPHDFQCSSTELKKPQQNTISYSYSYSYCYAPLITLIVSSEGRNTNCI